MKSIDSEREIAQRAVPGSRWLLISLLLFAVAFRTGWGLTQLASLQADPDAYRSFAEGLRQYGVYGQAFGDQPPQPSAFRPPLYPMVLAATSLQANVTTLQVALLHIVLGVLTCWLTFLLGRRWHLSQRWATCAALLVIVDPVLLQQASLVMTETLAALLTVALLYLLTRWDQRPSSRSAFATGVIFGLGVLCRPTSLPFAALIVGARGIERRAWPARAREMVAFGCGLLCILLPWAFRNQWQLGRPLVTTTHGGYTLLLGNNPYFYRYLHTAGWGEPWDAAEFHHAWSMRPRVAATDCDYWRAAESVAVGDRTNPPPHPRSELADDEFAYDVAKRSIREEPFSFLYATWVRIAWFWRPLPQALPQESAVRTAARYAVGVFYSLQWAAVLLGAGALGRLAWRRSWRWGVGLLLLYTLIHAIYWSNIRMRAPLVPVLALLASVGMSWGWCRVNRGKSLSAEWLRVEDGV